MEATPSPCALHLASCLLGPSPSLSLSYLPTSCPRWELEGATLCPGWALPPWRPLWLQGCWSEAELVTG